MSIISADNFPNQLRVTLHLLHCLQKERGASCANRAYDMNGEGSSNYFANDVTFGIPLPEDKQECKANYFSDVPFKFDRIFLETAMNKARSATDASFHIFLESCGNDCTKYFAFFKALEKIREDASKCDSIEPCGKNSKVNVHKLISLFNQLISNILDEAFMRIIEIQQKKVKGKINDDALTFSQSPPQSIGEAVEENHQSSRKKHVRQSSLQAKWIGNQIFPITLETSSPVEKIATVEAIKKGEDKTVRNVEVDLSNITESFIPNSDDTKLIILMNAYNFMSLLRSFSQLKESTGVERAYISSLMVIDVEDSEQESKLFSDLVIQAENQRAIIRQIKKQTNSSLSAKYSHPLSDSFKSLSVMINKYIEPSIEMQQIQCMINAFDAKGLKRLMPMTHFWHIISLYMNQLHSIELLILEELQGFWVQSQIICERINLADKIDHKDKAEHKANEVIVRNICKLFSDNSSSVNKASAEELYAQLSSSSGESFKQAILTALERNTPEWQRKSKLTNMCHNEDELLVFPTPSTDFKEWNIDLYEIEFSKKIGRGVAGTTYLGTWGGQQVAVKVAAVTDLGLDGWKTEIKSLQRLHHPNIIRLLGSIYNPSPETYGIVLEFCNGGDLNLALTKKTPPNFFWRVAEDVANGMLYLHRKKILHRDIKPANILLNGDVAKGNFVAKLTDFGLAIMPRDDPDEELTAETGTYRWMAPEVIRHESYSFMADVFSFGVVLWQLVTHQVPFQNMSQIEAAGMVAKDHERPPFPEGIPQSIEVLIENCWEEVPSARAPFTEIATILKDIQNSLSEKNKTWLKSANGHRVYPALNNSLSRRLHIGRKIRVKKSNSPTLVNVTGSSSDS